MRDFILGYFGRKTKEAQKRYRDFVDIMSGQEYKSPLKDVVASTILGTEGFIKEIKERYLKKAKDDNALPALKELSDKPSIQAIIDEVAAVFKDQPRLARNIQMYFCFNREKNK